MWKALLASNFANTRDGRSIGPQFGRSELFRNSRLWRLEHACWHEDPSRNRILELPAVGSFEHVDQCQRDSKRGLRLNRARRGRLREVGILPYASRRDVLASVFTRSSGADHGNPVRPRSNGGPTWTRAASDCGSYRRSFDRWPTKLGESFASRRGAICIPERTEPNAGVSNQRGRSASSWFGIRCF